LQAAAIAPLISALEASGALRGGQANSLASKLQEVIAKLNEGKMTTASGMLKAFVNEVSGLMSGASPVLSSPSGQALLDAAMR